MFLRIAVMGLCLCGFLSAEQGAPWTESATTINNVRGWWSAEGVIADFSFVGYQRGERDLPREAGEVSVSDFGAVANDGKDDTEAFMRCLAESGGKVIMVPEGEFILNNRLRVKESGTVLRGAGMRSTRLHFTRSLEEIESKPTKNGGGTSTTSYSWSEGLVALGEGGLRGDRVGSLAKAARRGSRVIELVDASDIEAGDLLLIEFKDDESSWLWKVLYEGDPGAIDRGNSRVSASEVMRVVEVRGNLVGLDRALRFGLEPKEGRGLEVFAFQAEVEEAGVEDLEIYFEPTRYGGHFKELGLNGIQLKGANNWVRDVLITNCDSGVFVRGAMSTLRGLVLETTREQGPSGHVGHHGVTLNGLDNLCEDFRVEGRWIHDLTVSGALGSVFSRGSGVDLNFDCHCAGPHAVLFTQIDVGKGARPFASGGAKGRGRHAGAKVLWWNIVAEQDLELPKEDFGPKGGLGFVNFGEVRAEKNDWLVVNQPLPAEAVNLYELQRKVRMGW